MKHRNYFILPIFAGIILSACSRTSSMELSAIPEASEEEISRIEPLNWWVGMKTPLQLLVQGEGIGAFDRVSIEGGKGIKVKAVSKAESPNYLFIDIEVAANAEAGEYQLVFSNGTSSFRHPYEFAQRRGGSAERKSFTTADLIYLIMPDRFANGDSSNDNTDNTDDKAARDEFFGRHGGDIKGIADHLDYLADLGVTAIWNTPLLEDNEPVSSYHGYACTDYYHIDSRFGSNEDYRDLIAACHGKGIKMIMDIVTNHCGDRHWWMSDLPFEDWVHQWPEYTHSNCAFSMQNDPYAAEYDKENMIGGWFDTSMVDMNLDNPYLLQYFKQWAIWWIEWADLDGLRVDTYPYNEKLPMAQWCKAVREEFPNINIVGEVWSNNVPQLAYWQSGNPNWDGFDSQLPSIMNFPLQSAMCKALSYDGEVNWDEGMVGVYDAVANDQYYHDISNMMIFTANHDTERLADVVGADPGRQKIALALVGTLNGIPQIFAGDEQMFTSADLSQGHGGLRVDFPGGWEGDAVDLFTREGRLAADRHFDGSAMPAGTREEVFSFAKKLFNWRKGSEAVQKGGTIHFLRRENTYAFFRYTENETVFVFINNSDKNVTVPWEDYAEFTKAGAARRGASSPELCIGTDVISGASVDCSGLTLMPYSQLIVEFK